MKVAIIGAGISGLTCAWLLHPHHEITLYESEPVVGGHSNTVEFDCEGKAYRVDTGFIVYNDRNYPNFMKLLARLAIRGVPTAMSFAVRCDRTGIEYSGSGLAGVFAQKRNLFRPSFLRMVADILRFNRAGAEDAERDLGTMTVGEYLSRNGYGTAFSEHYLLPMGAAIWSCPTGTFADFPIQFILEFYRNHGLLSLTNRPQWYTIPGGSRRYVERISAPFLSRIRTGCPVQRVDRDADGVTVSAAGDLSRFDEVIFACHSDQALRMLGEPSGLEEKVLSGFPYEINEAVLHTDSSVLPRCRKAWSAWNYRIAQSGGDASAATVTYNMNILQHIQSSKTFCVTLNDSDQIADSAVISRHRYAHPVFTAQRAVLQSMHDQLIRRNHTSYCGAYWGNGFHEDGVNSALAVCRRFGVIDIDGTLDANFPAQSSLRSIDATRRSAAASGGSHA
jgi:predicted NAD/FAD-binding protein